MTMIRNLGFMWMALACAAGADLPNTKFQYKPDPPTSKSSWEARKVTLRRQILMAAGLDPMPEKRPLNARVFDRAVFGPVVVEKVLLETWPGLFLGGNLYRPATGTAAMRPAILNPHGHWKNGRLEDTDEYSGPALGFNLARLGFVVFAYDMVGYNDTRQLSHDFGNSDQDRLWRFNSLGLQLWNSIRALDFLLGLPEVDPRRIGATGASGGGTQTFLLGAVDDRLTAAAPVNMISAHFQGGCTCENAPGLRWETQNVEIASMFAPKPMLMVAATGDWTKDTPKIEFPAVQAAYSLYGLPKNVEMYQQPAGHNYNRLSREAMYRFFVQRFLRQKDLRACAEQKHPFPDVNQLRALPNGMLPESALSAEAIRGLWKEGRRAAAMSDSVDVVRDRLARTLGVAWKTGPVELAEPLGITPGDPKSVVVLVHPGGAAAAMEWLRAHHQNGDASTIITVGSRAPVPNQGTHHLTFHRSDDAIREQDILDALAYAKQKGFANIRLVGVGKAAVWSVFAASVAPVRMKLNARLHSFDGTDEDFIRDFNVPGIQLAGGLNAALRLLRAGGVQWGEPHVDGAQ